MTWVLYGLSCALMFVVGWSAPSLGSACLAYLAGVLAGLAVTRTFLS